MGSEQCGITYCSSCLKDNGNCISCDKGYGLGGICIDETQCNRCIPCGKKCNTCHLCVCYECEKGYTINKKSPQNCIIGEEPFNPFDFEHLQCTNSTSSSFINVNSFFLIIFILSIVILF